MSGELHIRPFADGDERAVVALWRACELLVPWNDPLADIRSKRAFQSELFLVGELEEQVVASVMAGYEGHRGWINDLAVDPARRRLGLGGRMMDAAEQALRALGCPKINLQVRATNRDVLAFYERLGFKRDAVVSLGKRLDGRS